MDKYSKITKESVELGASENKIVFWDKTSNIEFLPFPYDGVEMNNTWEFIKTSTSTISLT